MATWAIFWSLRYWTKFVVKKLLPTPPLPLRTRLICFCMARWCWGQQHAAHGVPCWASTRGCLCYGSEAGCVLRETSAYQWLYGVERVVASTSRHGGKTVSQLHVRPVHQCYARFQ